MVRFLFKAGFLLLLLLLAALGTMWGVGSVMAAEHEVSVESELPLLPDDLWDLIVDFEGSATWRSGIDSVTHIEDRDGYAVFEEKSKWNSIRYQVQELETPNLLVMRIVDNQEFGGRWIFEIEPRPGGSALKITEDGVIHNAVFRVLSKHVMGHDRALNNYMDALKHKLGVAPDPTGTGDPDSPPEEFEDEHRGPL